MVKDGNREGQIGYKPCINVDVVVVYKNDRVWKS